MLQIITQQGYHTIYVPPPPSNVFEPSLATSDSATPSEHIIGYNMPMI